MSYLGDFDPSAEVYSFFNTRKADGTPVTLVGGAVAVYKDFSSTESTTGVALTTDYDSRTGFHKIVITTSADQTFYGGPRDYAIVLTAGTVDGVSVAGVVLDTFSVDRRSALRPSIAGLTIAVDGTGNVSLASGANSVNVSSINSVSTSPVTTVGANIGTTQPINFTGVAGLAKARVDVQAWASQTSGIDYSTLTGLPAVAVAAFYDRNSSDHTGHVAFDPTFANGSTILVDKINTALTSVTWTDTLATNLTTLASHDPGATLASQTNITSATGIDVTKWNGVGVTGSGLPNVNVKSINAIPTSPVTAVNANVGTTQPVNFTGTSTTAKVNTEVQSINGVSTNSVVNIRQEIGMTQNPLFSGTGATTRMLVDVTAFNGHIPLFIFDAFNVPTFSTYGFVNSDDNTVNQINCSSPADIDFSTIPTVAGITSALLSSGDIDGFTLEETLKLCLSALAGKLSGATGAATTIVIRAADDSKNRISAVVDTNGNRSTVTLDAAG